MSTQEKKWGERDWKMGRRKRAPFKSGMGPWGFNVAL